MSQGKNHKKRARSARSSGGKSSAAKSSAAKGRPSSKPDASNTPSRSKPKRLTEQRWVDSDRIAEHRAAQRRRTRIYRSLIAVVILLAAGTVGWVVYRSQLPSGLPDNSAKPPANYAVPAGATRDGVPVGQTDAPVTVDLYFDFRCPHCRDYERATAQYFDKQVEAGTVKMVYHPISIIDGYSVWAAAAAGCATETNALPRFTREVFSQQDQLNREELVAVGKNVDLTSPEFIRCVQDSKYQNWALGVTQAAEKAGVRSTPSVAVNGEAVVPRPRGSFEEFIDDTKRTVADAAAKAREPQAEQ